MKFKYMKQHTKALDKSARDAERQAKKEARAKAANNIWKEQDE